MSDQESVNYYDKQAELSGEVNIDSDEYGMYKASPEDFRLEAAKQHRLDHFEKYRVDQQLETLDQWVYEVIRGL